MKERGWTASAALWADKMVALPGVPILARQRVLSVVTIKGKATGRTVAVLPEVMESDLLILAGGAKLLGLCEAFLAAERAFDDMAPGGMPPHLAAFIEAATAQVEAMGGGDALIEPGACLVTGGS